MHVAAGVEQGAYRVKMPVSSGPVQRITVIPCFACVGIGPVLEQQPNRTRKPSLCHGVQSRPAAVVELRVIGTHQKWVVSDQAAQRFDVARRTRGEEAKDIFGLPLLDCRSERPPARKAVVPSDGEQCDRQLGGGVGLSHLLQAIFRQLFEVFE